MSRCQVSKLRPMDWEKLHANLTPLMTFLTVSRLGQFTAAADSLGINHATVARRISSLEKIVGDRLLIRSAAGWEPTTLGSQILEVAEEIEASLTKLVPSQELTAITGAVRVGAPEAFTAHVVVPILSQVQRKHPGLKVQLFSSTQKARQTRSGLDLEVVVDQPLVHKARVEKLVDYQLCLYASEEYLQRNGTPGSLGDLASHRLNYYVEPVLEVEALDRAVTKLPQMRAGIASTNVYAHLTATLAGAGLGLLPRFIAEGQPGIVPVGTDFFVHNASYWVVVRESSLRNPAVAVAYQALHAHAKDFLVARPVML